jgi:dimethylglycine dehydrogenase
MAPAVVARHSLTGEDGYELYVEPYYLMSVYEALLQTGADKTVGPIGTYAFNTLRIETGVGIWSRELSPDYTPEMSGLIRHVDKERPGFVGRGAVVERASEAPALRLVQLAIDNEDADASGFEPIWAGDMLVGHTTSGAYGHSIGKSLALGYIRKDCDPTADLDVHVVGRRRKATIIADLAADGAYGVRNDTVADPPRVISTAR